MIKKYPNIPGSPWVRGSSERYTTPITMICDEDHTIRVPRHSDYGSFGCLRTNKDGSRRYHYGIDIGASPANHEITIGFDRSMIFLANLVSKSYGNRQVFFLPYTEMEEKIVTFGIVHGTTAWRANDRTTLYRQDILKLCNGLDATAEEKDEAIESMKDAVPVSGVIVVVSHLREFYSSFSVSKFERFTLNNQSRMESEELVTPVNKPFLKIGNSPGRFPDGSRVDFHYHIETLVTRPGEDVKSIREDILSNSEPYGVKAPSLYAKYSLIDPSLIFTFGKNVIGGERV